MCFHTLGGGGGPGGVEKIHTFFFFEGFPKKYLQMNFDEDGWMENQILEGQITA